MVCCTFHAPVKTLEVTERYTWSYYILNYLRYGYIFRKLQNKLTDKER